jgi:hypothetical protein
VCKVTPLPHWKITINDVTLSFPVFIEYFYGVAKVRRPDDEVLYSVEELLCEPIGERSFSTTYLVVFSPLLPCKRGGIGDTYRGA